MIEQANATNEAKLQRLQRILETLAREVLRPGFHGKARIEFAVQNGTIQHLSRGWEATER
jgi:hypothetical protein